MPGFAVRPADISARVIANGLKDELGLTVVVYNRASARNSRNVYQLNYVWVEQGRGGSLKSDMTTFKEDPGKPF
jgi:hypothetical protein